MGNLCCPIGKGDNNNNACGNRRSYINQGASPAITIAHNSTAVPYECIPPRHKPFQPHSQNQQQPSHNFNHFHQLQQRQEQQQQQQQQQQQRQDQQHIGSGSGNESSNKLMTASQYSNISIGAASTPLLSHQTHIGTLESKYSTIRPLDMQVYQFMDYPFIISGPVIQWISGTKVMFIMRGPSGSGKTTVVNCIKDKYHCTVVCSSDLFKDSNSLQQTKSGEADNWHQNQLYQAVEAGRTPVIVDEPHVRCWEYKYSVDLASKFDYLVLVVVPRTPWRFDLDRLVERSPRSLPPWELEKSINQFEPAIPLYFGWFLNDVDSDNILQFTSDLLETMINIQEIRIGLASACDLPEFVSKEDLIDHWMVKSDRLHVTTKFCGYGTVADSEAYQRSGVVQESLGQLFPVHVRGLLLTPRTFSGHVQLAGPRQIQLWAGDDQEDAYAGMPAGSSGGSSLSKKTGSLAAKLIHSKPIRRPFGCRAHITLMYVEGTRPVQSGLDHLQVIDRQLQDGNNSGHFVAVVEAGTIVDWGQGRYYLELNQPIVCQALFTGQY